MAIKASTLGSVAIVTKKEKIESNTNYAQGGIAAVTSKEDSYEMHVRDTLTAGAGLCREAVVRTIVEEGPGCVGELIALGMQFTEREIPRSNGLRELDLGREGLLLLAIRDPVAEGGRFTYSPTPDAVVSGGSILIVLGEPEKVGRLSAQAASE